jgi:membrane-associated protease RseP (regulator of RpoE activity)
MAAGSAAHFLLGVIILWLIFAFAPLEDENKLQSNPVTIETVAACTPAKEVDLATKQLVKCAPGPDPASAASAMGLRGGDEIVAFNGQPVHGWDSLTNQVRAAGGEQVSITYRRDGQELTSTGTLPAVQRIKQNVREDPNMTTQKLTEGDMDDGIGVLGITPNVPKTVRGPVAAFGLTGQNTVKVYELTFSSLKKFPEKVPKLWDAVTGAPRDPETPVSIIGATRIGGELFGHGDIPSFLFTLATLNFFVGIFNLLPLLPLDGGHIAIIWFEKIRSWIAARLGRPDPGRVDYMKLMPLTYVVILIFGSFTLLTMAADFVNPITLFKQ